MITAPARDDLADGGADLFAKTIRLLKENLQNATVEILISDLQGDEKSLTAVLESKPDVFNHNLETVRRLTPSVRGRATYERTLSVLGFASQYQPALKTKSGLMVGLGESFEEIEAAFSDLARAKVQYLTVGQYLQPSPLHIPIQKFYTIDEFQKIQGIAQSFPFEKVFCGPLVRSSYHAGELHKK